MKTTEEVPEQICPECEGKGELRIFRMYVGCLTVGCWKCRGKGTIPIRVEGGTTPTCVNVDVCQAHTAGAGTPSGN